MRYEPILDIFKKKRGKQMEKKQIKYFSDLEYDKAYAYNFYIAPKAYQLLKDLNREHGLAISKTINLAILEYYKKVVSQK